MYLLVEAVMVTGFLWFLAVAAFIRPSFTVKLSLLLCSNFGVTKILHSVLTTYTIELIIGYDFLSSACDFKAFYVASS